MHGNKAVYNAHFTDIGSGTVVAHFAAVVCMNMRFENSGLVGLLDSNV